MHQMWVCIYRQIKVPQRIIVIMILGSTCGLLCFGPPTVVLVFEILLHVCVHNRCGVCVFVGGSSCVLLFFLISSHHVNKSSFICIYKFHCNKCMYTLTHIFSKMPLSGKFDKNILISENVCIQSHSIVMSAQCQES